MSPEEERLHRLDLFERELQKLRDDSKRTTDRLHLLLCAVRGMEP